jgi:hypothetical protein
MINVRRSFRYPAHLTEREATLHCGKEQIAAAIVDESAGGLGVIVADAGGLAPGVTLEIEEIGTQRARRTAKVTHVDLDDDLYRVGLEWF